MGLFDKFGKKNSNFKGSISVDKPPSITHAPGFTNRSVDSRFDTFTLQAMQKDSSISIQTSEYAGLLASIQSTIENTYPDLDKDEIFSQASAAFKLECPKCGEFNDYAKSMLHLSGTGIMDNSIFLGPKVAALGQGHCPTCGGTKIIATFSPKNIKERIEISKLESLALNNLKEIKPEACFPNQAFMDKSPDESLVCFLASEGINLYESGSNQLRWNLAVPYYKACQCRFVSTSQLLIIFKINDNQSKIQLLEVEKGRIIDEIAGPENFLTSCDVIPEKGIFVIQKDTHEIAWIETDQNRLSLNILKGGQIFSPGPKAGPDGKFYANILFQFCCLENDKVTQLMRGDHCIGFAPPNTAFSGGGHGDRSGQSELHIANLATGQISVISWGQEPIHEVFSAGEGRVMLANIVDMVNIGQFPNCTVTMLNLDKHDKEWSITIRDSKPYHKIILAVEPKNGLALIQSGSAVKLISLLDGGVLSYFSKDPKEFITATFLTSKRLIYLTRRSNPDEVGTLECYPY